MNDSANPYLTLTVMDGGMKNPIAVDNGHDPLLPKLGQKIGKIVLPVIFSGSNLIKPQFRLQCVTVPRLTQPIHKVTQLFVNQSPRFHLLRENPPIVHVPHRKDDLLDFDGGD
jgi:hypothetical protein